MSWFKKFEEILPLPSSYIVLDLETTGIKARFDYIVQFGHLVVEDCKPRAAEAAILDWPGYLNASHGDFRHRSYDLEGTLQKQGIQYRFPYETLANKGLNPADVLEVYYDMLTDHQQHGDFIVAHNGWRFDLPIISRHFERFLGKTFEFDGNLLIDTGLIEKASQLNILPTSANTLNDFYREVEGIISKGVTWSLSKHCVEKYNLVDKFKLDMANAHTADFDCYVTHLLMEEFRTIGQKVESNEGSQGICV